MGYRSSPQETTNITLFQKQLHLPIDREMTPPQNLCSSSSENDLQYIIQALLESIETLFAKASLSISATQKEQKIQYDRNHQTKQLPIGTMVLVKNSRQK